MCAAWCAGDARRSATGTDCDAGELAYGAARVLPAAAGGGAGARVCLLLSDVRDDPRAAPRAPPVDGTAAEGAPAAAGAADADADADAGAGDAPAALTDWRVLRARRADVGCAFNNAICYMHTREDALRCAAGVAAIAARARSHSHQSPFSPSLPATSSTRAP
jgi:hypothetical protein